MNPQALHPGCTLPSSAGGAIVRIPLRLRPGTPVSFRPEDVILQTGDIVYIQAREAELFYTAGLLPPGEHILPRDYDLDVVQAVARMRGPLFNGAVAVSNLNGTIVTPGLGNPSPSLLTVVRQLPGGGKVPIRVDLNRALIDPRERIMIQPGDVLVLQETPGEAIARYISEQFKFTLVSQFIRTSTTQGTGTLVVP